MNYERAIAQAHKEQSPEYVAAYNLVANLSRALAVKEHGEDLVAAAEAAFIEAAKGTPALIESLWSTGHPADFAVTWFKRRRS